LLKITLGDLTFPVAVTDISVSHSQDIIKQTNVLGEEFARGGKKKLKEVSFNAVLPFCASPFTTQSNPMQVINALENMQNSGGEYPLNVSGEISESMNCIVSEFEYSFEGAKPIQISVKLSESRRFDE